MTLRGPARTEDSGAGSSAWGPGPVGGSRLGSPPALPPPQPALCTTGQQVRRRTLSLGGVRVGLRSCPGALSPARAHPCSQSTPSDPGPGATCAQPPSASCGEASLTPGPRGCGGRPRSALMDCHLPRFALTPLMLTLPRERAAKKDSNNSRCNLEVLAMTRLILFSAAGRTIRVPLTLSGPDSFNYFPAPPSIRGVSLGL